MGLASRAGVEPRPVGISGLSIPVRTRIVGPGASAIIARKAAGLRHALNAVTARPPYRRLAGPAAPAPPVWPVPAWVCDGRRPPGLPGHQRVPHLPGRLHPAQDPNTPRTRLEVRSQRSGISKTVSDP